MAPITEGSERGHPETVTWNGDPDPCLGPGPPRRPGLRGRHRHRPAHRTSPRRRAGERRRLHPIRAARLAVAPRRGGGILVSSRDCAPLSPTSLRPRSATPRTPPPPGSPYNLTAVRRALEGAGHSLTIDDIHGWHRALMGPTGRLPEEMVGTFRTAQSWIGGTSPRNASFVPPPSRSVDGSHGRPRRLRQHRWVGSGHPGRSRPCPVRDHPPLRGRQRSDRADLDRLDPRPPHRDRPSRPPSVCSSPGTPAGTWQA